MAEKFIVTIFLLFTLIISISGCITQNPNNGTFGEKQISIAKIKVANNTTADHIMINDKSYFYIDGNIENKNQNAVFNIKIIAKALDAEGNVLATNDSADFSSTNIPAGGYVAFYVQFEDPDNKIVNYVIEVTSATAYP